MSTQISRFNPYTMDDKTILAVATGRKQPLRMVLDDLEDMLRGNGETTHLLVSGPRGIGKSFFARYLQIEFKSSPVFKNCRFVLFPEEQSNIHFPGDFVRMLLSQAEGSKFEEVFTKWDESEGDWRDAYTRLRQWIQAQREQHGKFLLVALVENMDELLLRFSGVTEGRFREMLERLPGFVLIGATPKADFDRDYNKPLFHAFKKYKLNRWKEEDFLKYFTRRRQFEESSTGVQFTPERIRLMENKLRAVSLFTGGSPRMAAVLSNLLLKDDLFSTASTLRGLIDELTPYYQDLTKSIPTNSRKLFDTLIRAGENLGQSELASLLGTSQNTISRAFLWLQENDYIRGEKREDSKSFRYFVNDRIYCLFYKTREIYHDQDYSPVWLLADLLVAYYEGDELRDKAMQHLEERFDSDTRGLAEVYLYSQGLPRELLPKEGDKDYWMGLLKEETTEDTTLKIAEPVLKKIEELLHLGNEKDVLLQLNPLLEKACEFLEKEEIGYKVASWLESIAEEFSKKYFTNAGLEILENTLKYHQLTKNLFKQAATLDLIGFNLNRLERHEEAHDTHQKILFLWQVEGNLSEQAWSLERIGRNLQKLGRHEEALEAHRKALALREEEGDSSGQAWNLAEIGWNLEKLGQYEEEALETHRKALALWEEKGDANGQAWNWGRIGWKLQKLGRHEESLEAHRKALDLWEEKSNLSGQAWSLSRISWNLEKLGRYEEAFEVQQKCLKIEEMLNDFVGQAWNLGHMGKNLFLLNRYDEAWRLLLETSLPKEQVFRQYGDAIIFKHEKENPSAAFTLANDLLRRLKASETKFDVPACLVHFFADLLEMKIQTALLQDICEEALSIFPSPAHQTIINATLSTVEYLSGGRQKAYLEKLPPDMATVVEAIVKEGEF